MVWFQSAKPIKGTITEEVRAEEDVDHEDPKEETEDKESDEGNENFQEESIKKNLELVVSGLHASSCSAINETKLKKKYEANKKKGSSSRTGETSNHMESEFDSEYCSRLVTQQNFTTNTEYSPVMLTTRPRSFAVDHNYAAGFGGPISEPWRPQNTYQQHPVVNQMTTTVPIPNQTIVPEPAFVDHNYFNRPFGMLHPMVQGPAFFVHPNYFNRPFGMQHQQYPNAAAPMMFHQHQMDTVPNLVRGQAPMMYQQGQQFMRPETNQQNQMDTVPNLVRGQAPMMFHQHQMDTVPNLVRGQAPMMYQQEQQFMRPETNQQNQMDTVPNLVRGQAPMMYQQEQPFMRPETNQQNQRGTFPFLIPRQAPMMHYPQQQVRSVETMTVAPSGWLGSYVVNQNHFNEQQFPIDMIQQASANEAAETATWPELNEQQMSQLQSQTQQPTQSQGFNAGPYSKF